MANANDELQEALSNLPAPQDAIANEARLSKLQELSNLVIAAATKIASDLKVFLPAESGFAFDLANTTWSGTVSLTHTTFADIVVKSVLTAGYNNELLELSSVGEGEQRQVLFSVPAAEVNQGLVNDTLRSYFEPQLTIAVKAHDAPAASAS